jgi:hypothetical protein
MFPLFLSVSVLRDLCYENNCAEGTLECDSSSYRFNPPAVARMPYEPKAESGSCCYRTPSGEL